MASPNRNEPYTGLRKWLEGVRGKFSPHAIAERLPPFIKAGSFRRSRRRRDCALDLRYDPNDNNFNIEEFDNISLSSPDIFLFEQPQVARAQNYEAEQAHSAQVARKEIPEEQPCHSRSLEMESSSEESDAAQEKFVVNLYESNASKRWSKYKLDKSVNGPVMCLNNTYITSAPKGRVIRLANQDNSCLTEENGQHYECIGKPLSSSQKGKRRSVMDIDFRLKEIEEQKRQKQKQNINQEEENEELNSSLGTIYSEMSTSILSHVNKAYEGYVSYKKSEDKVKLEQHPSFLNNTFLTAKQQVDIQCQIMKQASHVLDICSKKKEFMESTEVVLAEKILLEANYKREKLLEEIRNGPYINLKKVKHKNHGSVTVSSIQCHIKLTEQVAPKHANWLVCIVSSGSQVYCTDIVEYTGRSSRLDFKNSFTFNELRPNFEILVRIYVLRTRSENETRQNKFRINKKVTSFCKQSSLKFFHSDLYTCKAMKSEVAPSNFTFCGQVKVDLQSLLMKKWKLENIAISSPLQSIEMNAAVSDVSLSENHSGFFSICPNIGGSLMWRSKWCCLDNTLLKFWNYPTADEYLTPNLVIDLKDSLCSVSEADKALCIRSRTLELHVRRLVHHEETNTKHYAVETYLLAADSAKEFGVWKERINAVIQELKEWHLLTYQTYPTI